jgi:(S)-2-hydroxyglutarate dehydrogenase
MGPGQGRKSDLDVVVIGAGIVGLATARAVLLRHPAAVVAVLEKEARPALHQSGRNSGVIHSGIYYRPGSAKASMVATGRAALTAFCRQAGVDVAWPGKIVVAVDDSELAPLRSLERRALDNGIESEWLDSARVREREPHVRAQAALLVPGAGIVDFGEVCRALASDIEERGADLRCSVAVTAVRERRGCAVVESEQGSWTAAVVVNCAGLHADRLAATPIRGRIIPFRGEFYDLAPNAEHLVRSLVYPVPDPRFPFLGVHLTRTIKGRVHAGPNAVLALAREGYTWRDVDIGEMVGLARDPAFWRLTRRHWRTGAGEMYRSLHKASFARAVQRLVPDVSSSDLVRAPAGVRAQAISPSGELLDDFWIAESDRVVNVLNAPSPAATASLEIGRHIADRAVTRLT